MEVDAYQEWSKIFSNCISESYKNERKELQRASMLLTALQTELKSVHQFLELEIKYIKEKLSEKDILERKCSSQNVCSSTITADSPNLAINIEPSSAKTDQSLDLSPDIFRNRSVHSSFNSSIVDLSVSDEDVEHIEESPTLVSKRKKDIKRLKKDKTEQVKKNILKNVNKENMSVIEITPDQTIRKPCKKVGKDKKGIQSKKKQEQWSFTQSFIGPPKNNIVSDKEKPEENTMNSDKTFMQWINDSDTTGMGITQLLSFINNDNDTTNNEGNDNKPSQNEENFDSEEEVDEFSKGILFDETLDIDESVKKKTKYSPELEPVVRGNARKLLKGFSCEQCRNFYSRMKLSPEELQKKLDACSKHRYKYQPPEDTFPGIWDMTIPDEHFK